MGRKVKVLLLSKEEVGALEKGYKTGKSHCYRQRCRMVLLKAEGHRSADIAAALSTNLMSVNNWVSRYQQQGLSGLQTKPGRGRKPILQEGHAAMIRAAVEQERQRLSQAQQLIEAHLGKRMSRATLTRFLKGITAVTSA